MLLLYYLLQKQDLLVLKDLKTSYVTIISNLYVDTGVDIFNLKTSHVTII